MASTVPTSSCELQSQASDTGNMCTVLVMLPLDTLLWNTEYVCMRLCLRVMKLSGLQSLCQPLAKRKNQRRAWQSPVPSSLSP